jgi:proteasome assembly chaperone (PAC2) family protein
LETLLQIVGINIDMKNLEKRAKDTETLIQTIEQQMAGRMGQPQQQQGGTTRPSAMGYIS